MTCVMVATDGSDGAARAIDYASALALERGAQLLIANVVGGYGLPGKLLARLSGTQNAWLTEMLADLSASTLEDAANRARKLGAISIRLESREGEVVPALLDIARECHADLVVVGKRGTGQVAGLVLGSVSQKLVSFADLPVVVVP